MFSHARRDLPASIVVFLVALPLCLGIALASGAPPLAGVIAGIVGGLVVGAISGSQLGVSGPAAGLAVIVLTAIADLGGYSVFLAAVVVAGLLQVALGLMRMGVLAYYFPTGVIKGMLAGIGLIILLKQIPHAVGYNHDYEGDLDFQQPEHETTLSALSTMMDYFSEGSIIITAVCLAILIMWERPVIKQSRAGAVPGPLLAVLAGVGLGFAFRAVPVLALGKDFFVDLPDISLSNVASLVQLPDFSALSRVQVWQVGATMAVVASIETLLCVEASDKLDPDRRLTPGNRELYAQGIGNIVSGMIGGLPVTQVIVRSSANVQSGGKTKLSTVMHGFWLLLSLLLIPGALRLIPLASLAAILLVVGYKLARPEQFLAMWRRGKVQFVPFAATVAGVVLTDLLTGVMIGMAIGIFVILYTNYRVPFHFDPSRHTPGAPVRIELSEDVSFLNKASILRTLEHLPEGAEVVIDASATVRLDADVEEIIRDAAFRAPGRKVKIELIGFEHPIHTRRPASASTVYEQVVQAKHEREEAESSSGISPEETAQVLPRSQSQPAGATSPSPSEAELKKAQN